MKAFLLFWAGGLICVGLLKAEPVAPPPAITAFGARAPHRPGPRPASGPVQYSIGNPTDEEQFYLELLNRTRMNPAAEGVRLAQIQDPDTLAAYQYFSVDLVRLQSDLAAFPPVPPLAFEPRLTQAARGHSQWMLANVLQAHEETSPPGSTNVVNTTAGRITAAGYPFTTAGESVFAYAQSVENGHDAFEVDWGFGPGGVQNPPGHRINNHTAAFREIGIGVVDASNSVTNFTPASTNIIDGATNIIAAATNISTVGPQVVTFDFGARDDAAPLVTGVAYYDLNGNQFYDPGEGVGGITATLADNSVFAVTSASGGYALPAYNGSTAVNFAAAGLPVTTLPVQVTNGDNVKVDLRLTYTPPLVGGTVWATLSTPTIYSTLPLAGATAYVWDSVRRLPFTATLGAESGAGDFTVAISPAYSVIYTGSSRSGSASYHLAHPDSNDQILTLNARVRATSSAKMIFATRLAAATTNEYAQAQVSTNGGVSWVTLWQQIGRTNNTTSTIENAFTLRTNSLAAFADTELAVRFTYLVNKFAPGGYFPGTNNFYGFFLDDISFTGTELLTNLTASVQTQAALAFVPPVAGDYAIRVQPQIGTHLFPSGPWFFLSTTNGTPPTVHLTLATNGPGAISVSPAGGAYSPGTVVTLTATPAAGATFAGWSGGAAGGANPLTLTLNSNASVTANFIPAYTLATTTVGQGAVQVSPSKTQYQPGDVVTFTALPAAGWAFVGWAGDLSGTSNPTDLVVNTNKSVTATFAHTYSLATASAGQGVVLVAPQKNRYSSNDVVNLTAQPAPGWVFTGWSGDLDGNINPTNLVINTDKSVVATFQLTAPLVLGSCAISLGPDGKLRVDFSINSGTATSLTLERATDPAGPYSPLAATLLTNSPGNFSFPQIVINGAASYLRIRGQ